MRGGPDPGTTTQPVDSSTRPCWHARIPAAGTAPPRTPHPKQETVQDRHGECPREEKHPGEPGRRPPTGKPDGQRPNRHGDQPPEARPRCAKADRADRHRPRFISGLGSERGANRTRGCGRREATRSVPGQALKGEPRERARLKDTGEIVEGATRRSGQEPQGRNWTRGMEAPGWVALDGWVALWGNRTSGERCAGRIHREADPMRGDTRVTL